MKKTLLSLLLLVVATTMNGQTLLNGDLNHDGVIDLADVTALVNVVLHKAEAEAIDVYAVDNTAVVGTWYKQDGTSVTFRENGTTTYPGGTTYKYLYLLRWLQVYNSSGTLVKTMKLSEVTPQYLLEENDNGTTTRYTNAAYMVSGITLNKTSLSLNSGATGQLTATVSPSTALEKGVTWSSSNTSVATVSSTGLVTAVAGGTCTITCTAKDGSGKTATCEVTVTQLVTGITLNYTSLTLNLDENYSQTLTATVQPSNAANKNVTWESSDEDVAEVSRRGVVSANGLGTCTITCTAQDGSGVTATCTVRVVQLVTGITLSQTSLSLNSGDTQTLTATVQPSDASDKGVTWSSSSTAVAMVNQSGLVTAVSGGTCTITCTAKDGSGVTATCLVTVVGGGSDSHAYVDLGLPSGTLWATCNIGADNPEDYGLYFAWGETTGYTQDTSDGRSFNWASYKWCNGSSSTLTKYCNSSSYGYNGFTDTLTELEPEDDAAYVNWGSAWRMPSKAQFEELINSSYTTTTWTTQHGIYGRKITSNSNGNSLFLPAAGYRYDTSLINAGSYGYYWSRTLYSSTPDSAYGLYFYSGYVDWNYSYRFLGRSVRPVRAPQ